MGHLNIATWMYCAPAHEISKHHQVGESIGSSKTQDVYWRCVIVFFLSATATNPDARLLLFTNTQPPKWIDGQRCLGELENLGVIIEILEHFTIPPNGYHDSWSTQFAIIDILENMSGSMDREDILIVLDSDCIITSALIPLLDPLVHENGALQYSLDYAPEMSINGLTRSQLSELGQSYGCLPPKALLNYAGGEIVCTSGNKIIEVSRLARAAYEESLKRHERGESKFTEEAHLLTYVYEVLKLKDHTANGLIKRMWTDPFVHRNIKKSDELIPIWHLPAEKKTSFKTLYKKGLRNRNIFNDINKVAQIAHVTKGPGYAIHFLMRRVARQIIRWRRRE